MCFTTLGFLWSQLCERCNRLRILNLWRHSTSELYVFWTDHDHQVELEERKNWSQKTKSVWWSFGAVPSHKSLVNFDFRFYGPGVGRLMVEGQNFLLAVLEEILQLDLQFDVFAKLFWNVQCVLRQKTIFLKSMSFFFQQEKLIGDLRTEKEVVVAKSKYGISFFHNSNFTNLFNAGILFGQWTWFSEIINEYMLIKCTSEIRGSISLC